MSGLDAWLAGLGGPGTLGLAVAVLLGLRHASDPDHLTAVSTLLLSDERAGARRAGLLSLSWGLGHAVTLFAFGVPVILFRRHLPPVVQRGAEFVIGLVILGLALRLLLRWRRGYLATCSTHTRTRTRIRRRGTRGSSIRGCRTRTGTPSSSAARRSRRSDWDWFMASAGRPQWGSYWSGRSLAVKRG